MDRVSHPPLTFSYFPRNDNPTPHHATSHHPLYPTSVPIPLQSNQFSLSVSLGLLRGHQSPGPTLSSYLIDLVLSHFSSFLPPFSHVSGNPPLSHSSALFLFARSKRRKKQTLRHLSTTAHKRKSKLPTEMRAFSFFGQQTTS